MKHKSSRNIQNMTMFPLSYPIFLGNIRARSLMQHHHRKGKHHVYHIIQSIISFKNFNRSRKLFFNFIKKLINNSRNLKTVLQKIRSSHARKVINKNDKIPIPGYIGSSTWTLSIKVHKIKMFALLRWTRQGKEAQ